MSFRIPLPAGKYWLTQGFGGNADYYGVIKYLSYFEAPAPTVAPDLGTEPLGILNIFEIAPFSSPIQIKKSTPDFTLFLLNTQLPACLSRLTGLPRFLDRLYSSQTFRSMLSPFQMKSAGVFKDRLGRLAPYLSMNHSSHAMPVWGFPVNRDCLGVARRIYHERPLQRVEQYFSGWGTTLRAAESILSRGISALQNSHFICNKNNIADTINKEFGRIYVV